MNLKLKFNTLKAPLHQRIFNKNNNILSTVIYSFNILPCIPMKNFSKNNPFASSSYCLNIYVEVNECKLV